MTYTIVSIQIDEANGHVLLTLSKPVARPTVESVTIRMRLKDVTPEPRANFEDRARRAAKKVLQDAILSL